MAWTTVDRTYRIGHAILWEELLEEVERWNLSSRDRSELPRVTSRFLFAYRPAIAELGLRLEAATLVVPGHGQSLWAWLGGRPALARDWRAPAGSLYAFTNTFTEEESCALYERYHVPASGAIFWGSALANIHPGHQDTWVDYGDDDRTPLLFISGDEDHLMPPKIQQSNLKHYTSNTITEIQEFNGPHLLTAAPGWEAVADTALARARSHAAPPAVA